MSSPLKVIVPSVISYAGWPSRVLASVDLPEPLGPIRAWISPRSMSRSTPRRISRSSVRTCRSLISRSAMFCCQAPVVIGVRVHRDGQGGSGGERMRRRRARSASVVSRSVLTIEKRTRVHSSLVGQTCSGSGLARAHDRAVGRLGDALDRRDRALQRLDDLGHRDLAGGAREQVAAARAAARVDQAGLAQARDEVLEIGERQPVVLGDLRQRDRLLAGAPSELDHHAHAVLGLG